PTEALREPAQAFLVGFHRARLLARCGPGLELLPGLVEAQVLRLLPDAELALEDRRPLHLGQLEGHAARDTLAEPLPVPNAVDRTVEVPGLPPQIECVTSSCHRVLLCDSLRARLSFHQLRNRYLQRLRQLPQHTQRRVHVGPLL